MHAAMQPPEEGGAGEPPPGLRISCIFCTFPCVIPENSIYTKTRGKIRSKPYFLFILFIKRYLFLYNKRRQQLPRTWSFARPRVKALRTKWVHHPCQRACIHVIPSFTWVCELQSVYHINLW